MDLGDVDSGGSLVDPVYLLVLFVLAINVASDVLALLFRSAHPTARKRLVAASAALVRRHSRCILLRELTSFLQMRSARRPDVSEVKRTVRAERGAPQLSLSSCPKGGRAGVALRRACC